MNTRNTFSIIAATAVALSLSACNSEGDVAASTTVAAPTAAAASASSGSSTSTPSTITDNSSTSGAASSKAPIKPATTKPHPASSNTSQTATHSTQAASPRATQKANATRTTPKAPSPEACISNIEYAVGSHENASCAFANNILRAIEKLRLSGDSSENFSIKAYSPTTGVSYTMSCIEFDAQAYNCQGANNATVVIYGNSGFH